MHQKQPSLNQHFLNQVLHIRNQHTQSNTILMQHIQNRHIQNQHIQNQPFQNLLSPNPQVLQQMVLGTA